MTFTTKRAESLLRLDGLRVSLQLRSCQRGQLLSSREVVEQPGNRWPLFNVDGQSPPFGTSHQLETSLADDGGNPHGSVVTDIHTPSLAGSP